MEWWCPKYPPIHHSTTPLLRACDCRRPWQREGEGAAFAEIAFDPDTAAVGFHGHLAEGEAEAGGHLSAGFASLDLAELLENALEGFPGDALAAVAHPEDQL